MVNKIILVGRVGREPESRTLDNGTVVANFSMATTESYKDKATGEKKENTTWHSIVLWRNLAEIATKYVKKGNLVYIEGKHQVRSYEKDGVTRYITEIVGSELRLLGGSGERQEEPVEVERDGSGLPF